MPKITNLRPDLSEYLKEKSLEKKYLKSKCFFEENPFHPSLHTELLKPKERLIYSFRLDAKYRAIFIYTGNNEIEIIAITNHYK
jgi:Txe/YoeB family toxin of Txe-Axe toxin-antitoxin module